LNAPRMMGVGQYC